MRWLVLAVLVLSTPALADDDEAKGEQGRPAEKGTLGIGIILGEPTGVSARLYLQDDQAIQAAIGASFVANGIQADADYVFHPLILQDRDAYVLPLYVGPGVRFIDYSGGSNGSSHFAAGLRAVGGMLFDFKNVPLDAFLEVAGVLEYDFKNGAGVGLNLGAGVRYYF
jgi:hypothetical protein